MSKQTAVEWLVEQVNADCLNSTFIRKELIDKAESMMEWQIKDAYFLGCHDYQNLKYKGMHEYYNETFGGDKMTQPIPTTPIEVKEERKIDSCRHFDIETGCTLDECQCEIESKANGFWYQKLKEQRHELLTEIAILKDRLGEGLPNSNPTKPTDRMTAMQQLKSKIQHVIAEMNGELNEYESGYKQCLINIQNDIEAQMIEIEKKELTAMCDIGSRNDAIDSEKVYQIRYGK
jgi:hypothetical protein